MYAVVAGLAERCLLIATASEGGTWPNTTSIGSPGAVVDLTCLTFDGHHFGPT